MNNKVNTNDIYFNKYIKYKTKYIEELEQFEGGRVPSWSNMRQRSRSKKSAKIKRKHQDIIKQHKLNLCLYFNHPVTN